MSLHRAGGNALIPGLLAGLGALALAVALLSGCGLDANAAHAPRPVVTIPTGEQVFAPFIVVTQPHVPVTWTNADGVAHRIVTTPDRTAYLNPAPLALDIPAGKSASFSFTAPGLYDYYDPAQANWDGVEHRVAAKPGVPRFPLAMEGVIWVQGPVAAVGETATNPIPGKDEFASDFLAVREGGTVAWYNADTDKHNVALVPGWVGGVNPTTDAAPALLDGSDDAPPNGQTKTTTFTTLGLYYYYCSLHASVDQTWHRAVALPTASERPLPMETFVLVVPS